MTIGTAIPGNQSSQTKCPFLLNNSIFYISKVGYNIGVMNSPADFIKDWCNQTIIDRYDKYLTHDQLETLWSTIISIFLVGGCVGSLFAATIADKFGRFVSQIYSV